ncbi:MAG: preprotein translocase subunit YajC [Saprospiraceae bacterium]|nr:preprotein translocase subunit YajC [Saprospiraceae bacterium]
MLYILIQSNGGSFLSQMPLLAVLIAIFYFFFIRPSAKKQKEQDTFLTSLEKGQEVVTSSGIIGKINKITDKDITLQVSDKNFIRVTKGSISNELTNAFQKKDDKK